MKRWYSVTVLAVLFSLLFSGMALAGNQEASAYWTAPGQLAWDKVKGAESYIVLLLDETGTRVGNSKTKKTEMELFSFMGWHRGNESGTYKVLVEPRDSNNKRLMTDSGKHDFVIDSGVSIKVDVQDRKLSYSVEKKEGETYKLRVREKIGAGDVLLDTWRTVDGEAQCLRAEFPRGENRYDSGLRNVCGVVQEVRLLSDNRVRDGKVWELSLTSVDAAPVSRVIKVEIGSTTVEVDGRSFENDVPPVVKNGRTYLPIRVVAENLRAVVGWNNQSQSVTITKEGIQIEVPVGKREAMLNGKPFLLEQAAFVEKGRTYLPLRFVSEALGAELQWDGENRTATIIQML